MNSKLPLSSFLERSAGSDSDSSSTGEDDDQNWDDWESDSFQKQECPSLFDNSNLPSASEAIIYDREKYGFDLDSICLKLKLNFLQRVRLVNYIRKNEISSREGLSITGTETWFTLDEYLVPVLENDPLLQVLPMDDWSDDDADDLDPSKKIRALEKEIVDAQQNLLECRKFVQGRLGLSAIEETGPSNETGRNHDDDIHYFNSYAENDIHAIMIQDKVRTSTYAHFILTNPHIFRDKVVLDVGCGSGILSLFAARSGAKRVIAVDASKIAVKAEKVIKVNGFEDVVTVIQGQVENIELQDGITQVDIIISEWMGYALLYESMLDSVLFARDRFLRPGGLMVPSQCQMILALCDATQIYKDRVGFWTDVYGFDMTAMSEGSCEEAIVDVVGPETIASEPFVIKDLILGEITTRQLEFVSDFSLKSTVEKRTRVNSFVLYFDTFFAPSGRPIPPHITVNFIQEGDPILADIWPVGGKSATKRRQSLCPEREEITSFSTGPQSKPTHWKQTLFLLSDPIMVTGDSVVTGTFRLKKRKTNSRELDVEVHYSARLNEETPPSKTVFQMYRVQ